MTSRGRWSMIGAIGTSMGYLGALRNSRALLPWGMAVFWRRAANPTIAITCHDD